MKTRTNVWYHATVRGFKKRSLVSINILPPTKTRYRIDGSNKKKTKNVKLRSKDGSINDRNKNGGKTVAAIVLGTVAFLWQIKTNIKNRTGLSRMKLGFLSFPLSCSITKWKYGQQS
jgi:hypothetical protein